MNRSKVKNGDKFGHLICLEIMSSDGFGGDLWRCKCDCGCETNVSESMLISGVIKSCGCIRNKALNIKGRRFGMLTALEPVPDRASDGSIRWICRCDCGMYTLVGAKNLNKNRAKSCGCYKETRCKESKTFLDGTCVEIMLSETVSKNNTSGYRGVSKKGNKWHAYINYRRRRKNLGSYDTKELAFEARKDAEQKIREHLERLMSNAVEEDMDMRARDLFEDLKAKLGCEYISDLRYDPWIKQARKEIIKLDLSKYSLFELADAAEYLYFEKRSFDNVEDAEKYFFTQLYAV